MNRRFIVILETRYCDGREPTRGKYPAQSESRSGAISQAINDRLASGEYDKIRSVEAMEVIERDGVYAGGAA